MRLGSMGARGGFGSAGVLGSASIADWFVDFVNGNDNNTGKSPSQAFLTASKVQTAVGSTANQRIAIANGGTPRQQLQIGTTASPVNGTSVFSYGSGAQTVFCADDVAPNASFVKEATATFVWKITVSVSTDATKANWINAFENGTTLVTATSIANCDATAGSVFVSSHTSGTPTIYIHASDNSDITTNGKLYEYSSRLFGINLAGADCSVRNLTARRNHHDDGSIVIYGARPTLTGISCLQGTKHNCYCEPGTVSGSTFNEGYFGTTSANLLVIFEQTASGRSGTVSNCVFTSPALQTKLSGLEVHTGSGTVPAVTATNCQFSNLQAAGAAANTTTFTASGCLTNGITTAWSGSATNIVIDSCQDVNGVSGGRFGDFTTANQTITLNNNRICRSGFNNSVVQSTGSGVTLNATNNLVYVGTATNFSWLWMTQGTLVHTGNTIEVPGAPYIMVLGRTATVTYTSNNNVIVSTTKKWETNGTTYNSFALYQAGGAGNDPNSTTSGSAAGACNI
jgi:hypothetical protein